MDKSIRFHSSYNPVVINWMDTMGQAFNKISAKKIRHLPVIDDQERMIGILSDHDIQKAMQIDQPDYYSAKTPRPQFDPNARVRDYMTWPITTIDEYKSITDAARVMIEKKISSLIVVEGPYAVAVVTTEDLLKALIEDQDKSPRDKKDRIALAIFNSPISSIAQTLADVGL
jgi:acetoin utilization protein AcuB